MNKKLLVPLLLLLIIVTIAIAVIYLNRKSQNPQTKSPPIPPQSPTVTIPAESTLSFSPNTVSAQRGQSVETDILINSQGMPPSLAQLELAYDPDAIANVSLSPGTLFSNPVIPLNNIDQNTGRISYALNVPSNNNVSSFSGTVAKLKITIQKNSRKKQSTMYFLPKTSILSKSTTIPLKIAFGLKILITNPVNASSSAQP